MESQQKNLFTRAKNNQFMSQTICDGPVPEKNEIVMKPLQQIEATVRTGAIKITAGHGLRRSYTWDGETRSVEMWPRKKRWYGSLGLYFPGDGEHWQSNDGITRGCVQEGQMKFDFLSHAMTWLKEQNNIFPTVYSHDGLVVSFGKNLTRRELSVNLWQIYIRNEKPAELPDAQDSNILITDQPERS